jgi:hypothetical protein
MRVPVVHPLDRCRWRLHVHPRRGDTHILRGTMKELEELLIGRFQRVHRPPSEFRAWCAACART